MLTSMHTTPGESLEGFLQDSADGQYHAVQLEGCSQESRESFNRYCNLKREHLTVEFNEPVNMLNVLIAQCPCL